MDYGKQSRVSLVLFFVLGNAEKVEILKHEDRFLELFYYNKLSYVVICINDSLKILQRASSTTESNSLFLNKKDIYTC